MFVCADNEMYDRRRTLDQLRCRHRRNKARSGKHYVTGLVSSRRELAEGAPLRRRTSSGLKPGGIFEHI